MRGIVAQDDTKDYVKSLEKHLFEAKHQVCPVLFRQIVQVAAHD